LCGCDRDSRCDHVEFLRDGEARASPSARGYFTLVDGVLEDGMQWWWPIVNHPYEHDAWVIFFAGKSHGAKMAGDELQASKVNGFTKGEANASLVLAAAAAD
jgi:hypothetical protein